jgi:hypothetical protein
VLDNLNTRFNHIRVIQRTATNNKACACACYPKGKIKEQKLMVRKKHIYRLALAHRDSTKRKTIGNDNQGQSSSLFCTQDMMREFDRKMVDGFG